VERGQVISRVGDSGNAEGMHSQVHIEIRDTNDTPINPYQSLLAAQGEVLSTIDFDPEDAKASSPTINHALGLEPTAGAEHECVSNSLIKSPSTASVYYCGADGKRYVFSNSGTYFSWYDDFKDVITITEEELAAVPLGGNVTYRPGVRMLKIQSDPKVYAVDTGGTLRWVSSAFIAEQLYGENWADNVEDIAETFFINYQIGEDI
jgi:hypothetical protein